jgi:hypothetical protein
MEKGRIKKNENIIFIIIINIFIDYLKIGDYITLKNPKLERYLSAEGILIEDLVATDSLISFEDCLFCVNLQRQYSAARELEEFQALYDVDDEKENSNTQKYLAALQVNIYIYKNHSLYYFNSYILSFNSVDVIMKIN